ncbi:MAG: murein hydrolase activator EnvC family protein [Sphingomonadaceae bacterium]
MGRTGAAACGGRHCRIRGTLRQARRRTRLIARVALGIGLAGALAAIASAQSIDEQRRALARAKTDAQAALARSQRIESAASAARDDAARARARSAAVAARIQSAEAEIDAAEARIAIIDRLRTEQRARLAARQGPTIRLVAALQSMARRPPALALVQPGSVTDIVHLRATLAAILPVVQARTADVRSEVARSRTLRAEADAALAALRQSQRALVAQRNQLAGLALERRRAAEALGGSAMAEQDRAIALGEQARDIVDLMSRIDDAAAVGARLAALPGPVRRPQRPGEARALPQDVAVRPAAQAPYRLPVIGRVVSGLGEVSRTGVRERGLTIATRPAAQVVAPTGGRIVFAAPYRSYGNIVIIDHGSGWTTLITGLAVLDAKVGDAVDPGSPLGRAGADQPSVTVELRRGGEPVDIGRLIN